jgi:urea transport system permease protein
MRLFAIFIFCVFSFCSAADPQVDNQTQFSELMSQLPDTKLQKMPALINNIAATKSVKIRPLLTALVDGDLYFVKANKVVIKAQKNTNNMYETFDVFSRISLGELPKNQLTKIRTNNAQRSKIRDLLAQIDLSDENVNVRLEAVQQLLNKPSKNTITMLTNLIDNEANPDVQALMQIVLSVNTLQTGSLAQQLIAVEALKGSLEPSVKNTMTQTLENLPRDAEHTELAEALKSALQKIEERRNIFSIIENLFFGLSLGSVLLLAAIGLTITFGVMGVINMAHGEMMMLGAYTTYVIQQLFPELIEYSLLMAIPAAFIVSGSVGILIERGVIRHLKGRPLETLLATFGISLILQQLVRTLFSPLNRQVASPEWMSGSWIINPVFSLTYNRLYIIIFSLMVFFALMLILQKTSLGLHVRAVSQNRDMARALSIKSNWVDAMTFGLGSGIAGIAGVVLSQLTNVGPNLGQAYIIDSFLVVVFGGVGNLWGTLVAAMSLGSINKFLEPVMGSVLANIIVLVGLVLFIQKRPKGLFPQKGRSAD